MDKSFKSEKFSEHGYNFRVPLSYIDIGGVIYNGKYLDIYNQARDEYLRDIGFPYVKLNHEFNYHLSVVEVNIKYRKPVHYDDLIEIVTRIEKFGRTSLVFEQTMYDTDQRQNLCNTARSVLVCTNSSREPKPLPEEFKTAARLYKG